MATYEIVFNPDWLPVNDRIESQSKHPCCYDKETIEYLREIYDILESFTTDVDRENWEIIDGKDWQIPFLSEFDPSCFERQRFWGVLGRYEIYRERGPAGSPGQIVCILRWSRRRHWRSDEAPGLRGTPKERWKVAIVLPSGKVVESANINDFSVRGLSVEIRPESVEEVLRHFFPKGIALSRESNPTLEPIIKVRITGPRDELIYHRFDGLKTSDMDVTFELDAILRSPVLLPEGIAHIEVLIPSIFSPSFLRRKTDAECWRSFTAGLYYPAYTARRQKDVQLAFEILYNGGFARFLGRYPRQYLEAPFTNTNLKLAQSPHLGFLTIFPAHQEGYGITIASLRAYTGTWVGHQISARVSDECSSASRTWESKNERKIVRRENLKKWMLYLHSFCNADYETKDEYYPKNVYLFGYLNRGTLWMKAHSLFVRRANSPLFESTCNIPPFFGDVTKFIARSRPVIAWTESREWEVDVLLSPYESSLHPVLSREYTISSPDRFRSRFSWRSCIDNWQSSSHYNRQYLEALDFEDDVERYNLRQLSHEFQIYGLQRARWTYVVRKNERLLCWAVAETTSPRLNIMGLLDVIRIFFPDEYMVGKGALTEVQRHDLRCALRSLFFFALSDFHVLAQDEKMAEREFSVVLDFVHKDHHAVADVVQQVLKDDYSLESDPADGVIWCVPIDLLGDWIEHISELTCPSSYLRSHAGTIRPNKNFARGREEKPHGTA